jgi:hypothetical protein
MGKHEVIKPTSTERVRKHRTEMRAKGYRLKQVWVPNVDDPSLAARLREESIMIGQREEEEAVQRWVEAVSAGIWDDEPDYKL